MRAALFSEHGGPEVVRIDEVRTPEPGPGEVRVAVQASSMNHLDLWVRRGLPIETTMPHIGGSDIVGVVDAVGPGVEDVVGTRVVVDPSLDYDSYEGRPRGPSFDDPPLRLIGEHTDGGHAEHTVVPADNCLEVPDGFPAERAAAAGLVFVTAWRALLTRGRLRPGERVLVTGGSGGVGTAAVQIARRAGAEVHAVTSGPENRRRLEALGADAVYDRLAGDWAGPLREATGGRGVDVAFDAVGQAVWESCLRSLAVGGRLVTSGATTGAAGKTEIRHVFWKQLSILGSTMGTPAEFREVMGLVFAGRLEPVVHEVVPLEEARRAHELMEEGDVFGKLVIVP
jgi:NADPH:quinone reductase-like Zn-dependent oxidoreductase